MSTCLTMAKVNAFDVYIKYVKVMYVTDSSSRKRM